MNARATLSATYRVQLNHRFTFRDATALVPYLQSLGISHLYCSPILAARRGSMHGYDVVDPTRLNPELGSDDDLRALAGALHERGMGMIVDIVPNHMGIGNENPFWTEVLTHGQNARYAHWFDIDWAAERMARGARGRGKIVLPVLEDELESVLARDEIELDIGDSEQRLVYKGQTFPLDPASLTPEMQLALWDPKAVGDPVALAAGAGRGRREGLRRLLDAQHYRLTFWRRANTELDYRRFFDINDLVALRMEDGRVFAETHAYLLTLVRQGIIDGLRVDHVDGLRDPLTYLRRLRVQVELDENGRQHADSTRSSVPIFVEKILSPGERLRGDWPVQGTTGYEFLNDLEDVFMDDGGFRSIERSYRRLRRLRDGRGTFADQAYAAKLQVLRDALQPDVRRLVRRLEPLAEASGHADWATSRLAEGLMHFIAALPVYRTYIDGRAAPHQDDREAIARAVAESSRRNPATKDVVLLIASVLLDDVGRESVGDRGWLDFVQRLQQTSGPATAKGVEDTALYRYVPLASRNEVGGSPDRPLENATQRLHGANAERAARWPAALICTNTHDTKRSADLRARLDVLTGLPGEWERRVRRWRRLNSGHRGVVRGRIAPDRNTEYLFYQTLFGLWPSPASAERDDSLPVPIPDGEWRTGARQRLQTYMIKAAREAKVRTSWVNPDTEFEEALRRFIAGALEPSDDALFLTDVAELASQLARAAALTSLARVLLHLTAPGTPDLYQGDELWNLALVDPDNRQPVDYEDRGRSLHQLGGTSAPFTAGLQSPQTKLFLTTTLLRLRREHPKLFGCGHYLPLLVDGSAPGAPPRLLAYLRSYESKHAIVVAPRPATGGGPPFNGSPQSIEWGTTVVTLPAEGGLQNRRWHSVLDSQDLSVDAASGALPASLILRRLPFALLLSLG